MIYNMFYHSIGESFGGDRKAICIIHCLLGCLERPINLVMKKTTLESHMYISFVYIYGIGSESNVKTIMN